MGKDKVFGWIRLDYPKDKAEEYIKEDSASRIDDYKPQKRFKKCVNKRKLPFDFYLPKLNLCIEYDGRQHFEPVEFFGGEDVFILQRIKDSIKNEYCHKYGRGLIRIPYTVKERLPEFLDHYIHEYRMNDLIERIEHIEVQLYHMQKNIIHSWIILVVFFSNLLISTTTLSGIAQNS